MVIGDDNHVCSAGEQETVQKIRLSTTEGERENQDARGEVKYDRMDAIETTTVKSVGDVNLKVD